MSDFLSVSVFCIDLNLDKTLPTEPLALVSTLTLSAESFLSCSYPKNLDDSISLPPYCLIDKKSAGIPKQL